MGVFLFYLVIGALIALAIWIAMRAYAQADSKTIVGALKIAGLAVGGVFVVWLVISGRLGQALMLAAALTPLVLRWKSIATQFSNLSGPRPGQTSDVETKYLRMTLAHDTGDLDGVVRDGRFRGRRVAELSDAELGELLSECRLGDDESARLLEAYLDRARPDWRAWGGAAAGSGDDSQAPSAAMTREEAYRILGLAPGADAKAIRDAHRRLMLKLHPDQGGSDYLAAKINQAKDLLLSP